MTKRRTFVKPKVLSPSKTFGGKTYLVRRFLALYPPEPITQLIVPYMGGMSTELNISPEMFVSGRMAIFSSDLDPMKVLFFNVVKERASELKAALAPVVYCESAFKDAVRQNTENEAWVQSNDIPPADTTRALLIARSWIIANRMSRDGLGKDFAWSDRLRGGQPGEINAWQTMVRNMESVGTSLRHTSIQCCRAIDALQARTELRGRGPRRAMVYLDPPYMHSARSTKTAYGKFEMDPNDHYDLASAASTINAHVMISGYDTPEYRVWYHGWWRMQFEMPNHAGQTKVKQRRKEIIWCNYQPSPQAVLQD